MIGGEKKEQQEFKKYVGLFKGKVVAISPTKQQLNKIFGKTNEEDDKEIEYTGEKEGVDTAKVVIWLKVEGKDTHLAITFNLKNETRYNKEKTKLQLINQVGDTSWVDVSEDGTIDKSNLWSNFKAWTKVTKWGVNGEEVDGYVPGAIPLEEEIIQEKQHREALVGEEKLTSFVKNWLSDIKYNKPGANILLDTNKLFSGNFKELSGQIGGDYSKGNKDTIVGLAYISVDENDAEKVYQRVWTDVMPGSMLKFINNNNLKGWSQKVFDNFKKSVENDYGVDGYVTYDNLREYNPEEDLCAASGGRMDEEAVASGDYD